MSQFKASIFILLGSASYGILSTITKLAYQDGFSTGDVVGCQGLFGCLFFWILQLCTAKKPPNLSSKTIGALMISGSFTGLTGIFYYLSLQTLPASYAVILLFQFTWMGMLLDWFVKKQRPSYLQWAALVFILSGTFLALGSEAIYAAEKFSIKGILLGLLAAASYTLFINFSGQVANQLPTLIRSTWMITGSVVLVFLVFPPHFLFNGALPNGLWFWGSFLAIFGAIIPPYLFAKGVPYVGTGMSTILGSVELPTVIVFSSYMLKEKVTALQLLGIVTILIGIIISVSKDFELLKTNMEHN